MKDLQHFHSTVNEFLALVNLPAERFEGSQDHLNIDVEGRFTVRIGMDASGILAMQGDWTDGLLPAGLHDDWLMANQICPGALQPVIALDDSGNPTCWLRLPQDMDAPDELLEAFDLLLGRMDQLTPGE
ncbi:hypothetical protein D9O50_01935 [Oxalobacteraceae bacterium CAVE-383]|nr:hypothetical protein D9O50_01935 [Oxalobacteraceae bacterium CAVE-383]